MIIGAVRDILIIFLALTSIVVWVMLGILIWQIWRLTKMVQSELKPMMADTKETISTVRGTANFMSENVVTPVIQTSSRVANYRRTAMAMFGQLPRNPPTQSRASAAFTSPVSPVQGSAAQGQTLPTE
ncbi:MAG: hypothetical protein R6W76_13485 [Caldilinea sp.]